MVSTSRSGASSCGQCPQPGSTTRPLAVRDVPRRDEPVVASPDLQHRHPQPRQQPGELDGAQFGQQCAGDLGQPEQPGAVDVARRCSRAIVAGSRTPERGVAACA